MQNGLTILRINYRMSNTNFVAAGIKIARLQNRQYLKRYT